MYSMLFHTLMVYMGILYLFKLEIKLEKSKFNKFTKIYCFFAVIAIYLNTFYGSNLMLLKKPFVNDNITMNRKWKIKMYKNDH